MVMGIHWEYTVLVKGELDFLGKVYHQLITFVKVIVCIHFCYAYWSCCSEFVEKIIGFTFSILIVNPADLFLWYFSFHILLTMVQIDFSDDRPDITQFGKLDSNLKKNTAYVKKLVSILTLFITSKITLKCFINSIVCWFLI